MKPGNFITSGILIILGFLIIAVGISAIRAFFGNSATNGTAIDESIDLKNLQKTDLPSQLDLE